MPDPLAGLFEEKKGRRPLPDFGLPDSFPKTGNAGLHFERIGVKWKTATEKRGRVIPLEERKLEAPKEGWADAIAGSQGNAAALEAYAGRINTLASLLLGEPARQFSTEWRLLTGVGIASPLENGLTWHRSLGVPYLPGSGVKGLVHAYVREWAEEKVSRGDMARIFGQGPEEEAEENGCAGSLVFFDAVPVKPVRIVKDVLTVHHRKYYQGADAPHDRESPVPVLFVAVTDATLQFAIAPSPRFTNRLSPAGEPDRGATARKDAERAFGWLTQALAIMGAGAKTSANYGRMKPSL